jgi:hypothetical protein
MMKQVAGMERSRPAEQEAAIDHNRRHFLDIPRAMAAGGGTRCSGAAPQPRLESAGRRALRWMQKYLLNPAVWRRYKRRQSFTIRSKRDAA